MENNKVARLVQPTGSIATKHASIPSAGGKARSVRTTRTTWLGTALAAMVCSGAVMATSIAPMASGSTLRRAGRTTTNNVVNAELGRLQETGGIASGTILGMENFLRDFPPTAAAKTVSERATNNVVNTQLGRLQETGGIASGTILGMENFLRDFPPTA